VKTREDQQAYSVVTGAWNRCHKKQIFFLGVVECQINLVLEIVEDVLVKFPGDSVLGPDLDWGACIHS